MGSRKGKCPSAKHKTQVRLTKNLDEDNSLHKKLKCRINIPMSKLFFKTTILRLLSENCKEYCIKEEINFRYWCERF